VPGVLPQQGRHNGVFAGAGTEDEDSHQNRLPGWRARRAPHAAEEILCGCGVSRHFWTACCNYPSVVDHHPVFLMRHILTAPFEQEYRRDHRVNGDIGRGA
jgi:hypothetical protein